MKIVSRIEDAREIVKAWKTEGLTVGFVPTMGYLHEGHESLIKKAFDENDRVVVSVFINAKQFGEKEDFSTYPKDLERDSNICALSGAHMVFNPRHEAMYPDGFSSYVDMEDLTENLCGKVRGSHFRGVCTVLAKLFNIIQADRAYFGKKDAQQIVVVKKMVCDLNFDMEIIECETVRETDGLAKSSRNVYLKDDERRAAPIIWEALQMANQKIVEGERNSSQIKNFIETKLLTEKLLKLDYVEIVEAKSLKPVDEIKKGTLLAVAVFIGDTRLIDNFTF